MRGILTSNAWTRNPTAKWWLIPSTGLLLFLILNLVMPLNADDFGSKVVLEDGKPKLLTSFSQLIKSMERGFLAHNARLGQIYYLFSLTFLPRWLNSLALTIWVGSLVFLLLRIALRRNIQPTVFDMTLWLGILSLVFLPLQRVENFITYTAGLYNYIPGGVGTFLVLDKMSRWFIEKENSAPKRWLYIVGFCSGWSNEVYGFFMIPLFALLIAWHVIIKKRSLATVPSWIWYLIITFVLGFAILICSPGLHARSSKQAGYDGVLSFIMPLILYVRFALLATPLNMGIVFMLLLFMHKEDLAPKNEKTFFSLLLVSTAGIIFCAAFAGFHPYGRALWGVYLVLAIILAWASSHLLYHKIWVATVPVVLWTLTFFGLLIWNTYVIRTQFEHIEQAFIKAGKRGDKVLLVDFPELRKGHHSLIMRDMNKVVLVQRNPTHWLNRGLVQYYKALYDDKEGFEGPSYIILDNLVPPYLNEYAFDTRNDPLNQYPEIQSLIERQKVQNKGENDHYEKGVVKLNDK